MQSTPVDLDAQQFLDSNIAKMDLTAEVIEESELAWLIGRFEQDSMKTEFFSETIREGCSQTAVIVKEADTLRAFTSFHHQLQRAGFEPAMSLIDPL